MDLRDRFLKPAIFRLITPEVAVPTAALFVLVILLTRNCGVYPSVFDDEWIYSKFSRLAPAAQAPVPSYLFFLLFGFTRYAGEGFLEGARILNSCFFAVAMTFTYLVCRRVTSWKMALFVALISVLGPISAYSAFFMPESMYFCGFWFFAWFVLRGEKLNPQYLGIGSGVILGMMAGIKFHAIFLVAGLCGYLLLCWLSKSISLKSAIISAACAISIFFLVRFTVAYHYAGIEGLNFTGARYGAVAGPPLVGDKGLDLLRAIGRSLIGHLLALCFLLSAPLATAVSLTTEPNGREQRRLQLFALSFLAPLLFISALSTALFAGHSPYDTMERLHLRYYNFIFPVFFIIAAAQAKPGYGSKAVSLKAKLFSILIAAATLYATLAGLKRYAPNFVDSPELVLVHYPTMFLALGLLSTAISVIWPFNRKLGSAAYLFAFLPVATLSSLSWVNAELRYRLTASIYDRAGQVTRKIIGAQASKLIVVGSDLLNLNKALFHVDNPNASILDVPEGAAIGPAQIPADKSWILLIGNHQYIGPAGYKISMGGFSLLMIGDNRVVDFKDAGWPGVVAQTTGLEVRESFGQWSVGDQVRIEFASPLPKKARLTLSARAFGPNADLPFTLIVGSTEQQFRLGTKTTNVSLSFDSSGSDRWLIIKVPKPTSSRELWGLPDDRLFGIGLEYLSIMDLSKS